MTGWHPGSKPTREKEVPDKTGQIEFNDGTCTSRVYHLRFGDGIKLSW